MSSFCLANQLNYSFTEICKKRSSVNYKKGFPIYLNHDSSQVSSKGKPDRSSQSYLRSDPIERSAQTKLTNGTHPVHGSFRYWLL